jgi:hypothetical protein
VERQLRVVLVALSLAWSSVALGSEGPRVPDDALLAVPDAVRAEWRPLDDRIAALDREIQRERSARSVAESLRALDEAREDLRVTLMEATNLEVEAISALQEVRLQQVDARIRLDRARLEERLADEDLEVARKDLGRRAVREARIARRTARTERKDARDAFHDATGRAARTERITEEQLAVADDAADRAQDALDELGAFASTGMDPATDAELALLEAERDLTVAQLEHDRAVAVVAAGILLPMRQFVDALEVARSREEAARRQ